MSFMEQVVVSAKASSLIALTALFVVLGMTTGKIYQDLSSFQTTAAPLVQKASLDLDEAHRLILETGLTAMEARKASAEERAALPVLTKQAQQSLTNMDALLVAARKTTDGVGVSQQQIAQSTTATLATLNTTIQGAQPVLVQAQATLAELHTVATTVNAQASDPAIADTLHHIDATTASVEATAKDVQLEVHGIVHPGWAHRIWEWSLDIGHLFNPL